MGMLGLCWFAAASAAGPAPLLFGVSEGTSGSIGFSELQDKYKPLADYLAKILKRPVLLESASDLKNLTKSLDSAHYGLLLVRPSHISAKAMRDQKYVLVAAAKGDAIAQFIVHKDSPLKQSADLKGKSIVMPDNMAYPTWIGLAMLRDIGIGRGQADIRNFRSQEAVGYAVEQKLSDVGVVISYSKVAKDWAGKGHRVLWESKKLPYWSVIGSPKLAPEEMSRIREALIKLDQGDEGQKILKGIGVKGFVPGDQAAYLDMLKWVGY
jgi:ABC-type phosphate/phosphonate transport system substrate-binding protein